MAGLGQVARRGFLVGAASVVGGVAFGAYRYMREIENPLRHDPLPGTLPITPYVIIDATKITLIAPRLEMGQGAMMVQAMLIAEELDVKLAQVSLLYGPPSQAYYNSVVAREGMPVAAISGGWQRDAADLGGDILGKLASLQITGGSSTVRDAYVKLRLAGAVARETLKEAAARLWSVSRLSLKTEAGRVFGPQGQEIAYQELANLTAALDPVDVTEEELRPPQAWTLLGKTQTRIDIKAKSTGRAVYGIDRTLPNMLFATIRTSPYRAGMQSYDVADAETMRGVFQIVPVPGGVGVLADNTWHAFQAMDRIRFTWRKPDAARGSEDTWQSLAAHLQDEYRDSRLRSDGDVDAHMAGIGRRSAEYRVPYLLHGALEPVNITIWLRDGQLNIWTATQVPLFVVDAAADFAEIYPEHVKLHVEHAGGSFGRRLEIDHIERAVALARYAQGRPVKIIWQREEDSRQDFPRPAMMAQAAGFVRDGQIAAFDLKIVGPSVAASQSERLGLPVFGPDTSLVAGAWDQPFAFPNYRVTGYRAEMQQPVSSWRSVGASANAFFHESFVDELLAHEGLDPVSTRLRQCSDDVSQRVIERVADLADWGRARRAGEGRGLAFTLSSGVPAAIIIDVLVQEDGIIVDNLYGVADVGQVLDPVNCRTQMSGGALFGLGHAMFAETTYEEGAPVQQNFDAFDSLRLAFTPKVEVEPLEFGARIRGIGEPMVPPAAPALGNAIFDATGQRLRQLPFVNDVNFIERRHRPSDH